MFHTFLVSKCAMSCIQKSLEMTMTKKAMTVPNVLFRGMLYNVR